MKEKVFISWSGPLGKEIAEKLHSWLRKVIQQLDPFVSTRDISKGDVWLLELLRQLDQSSIGIICITRQSLHADWILFEAGALTRQVERQCLCTLLVDVTPDEVGAPLSAFQTTTFKREDILRLLQSIHAGLKAPLLSGKELEEQFSYHWPELEAHFHATIAAPSQDRSELSQLAQELLLPVIYREAISGDLDTVFHWLEIAKRRKVADLETHLAFVEAALARLAGKRGANYNLRSQGAKKTDLGCLAQLELSVICCGSVHFR